MDIIFITGLVGSLILVLGAAWPDRKTTHPAQSIKNWLFAIGGLVMCLYALLSWMNGGPIFFLFLEILVVIASVFMMLNVPDSIDTPLIAAIGIGLILWSLTLFEGYNTVFFILGLSGIGMGYALDMGTFKRELALTAGSALIAIFSYIEASWIFFWLNVFFALFSGYYAWKIFRPQKRKS